MAEGNEGKGLGWGTRRERGPEVRRTYEIVDGPGGPVMRWGRVEAPALGAELHFWRRCGDMEASMSDDFVQTYLLSSEDQSSEVVRDLLLDFCRAQRKHAYALAAAREKQEETNDAG